MTKHNLPSLVTSFIGRTREAAEIGARLQEAQCRLLTLLGPGGIGKTRLAIEVARKLLPNFPDGVHFVALQSLSSVDAIVPTTASLIGLPVHGDTSPEEQLLQFVQNKQILLVMDNFEHVLGGAELLAEMVYAAPLVKILVTSREALNLKIEWLYHVRGLSYPQADDTPIKTYSAITLFAERARQVQSSFSLDAEHDCVARVCRLVEGMPLAIELAASWLKHLSCTAIGDEIEHSLDFLATGLRDVPERQRSIRAVFTHSWQLLTQEEQAVFAKLSIFWGGFTRQTAETVTHASLFMLSNLVDKSLLQLNPDGRYDMHDLLRQFAEEKLAEQGAVESLHDAHCAYYLKFLAQREADLKGRRQLEGMNEIDPELENIRVAWAWAIENKHYDLVDAGLESLSQYLEMRNRWLDYKTLFKQALDGLASPPGENPHPVWGRLLTRYTGETSGLKPSLQDIAQLEQGLMIARQQGNLAEEAYSLGALALLWHRYQVSDEILTYAQQCLAIYQALGDGWGICFGLAVTGNYYERIGEVETGLGYWRQCEDLARELGDQYGLATTLSIIGYRTFGATGNYTECERYWQEAYTIRHAFRASDGIAMSAAHLSQAALLRGDLDRARELANESLAAGSAEGWRQHVRVALTTLGHIAIAEEHYDEAWHLFEKSQANNDFPRNVLYTLTGFALVCCSQQDFQAAREHVQAALTLIEHIQPPVFWTELLPPAALILAYEGQIERATALLGLAFGYPGSLVQMMASWPLMTNTIAALKADLEPERFAAAWERGVSQDFALVVASILEQFGSEGDTKRTQQTRQGLVESLSERELEVLHLIAEGLSNREIAGELVVTVGTVKKHINNIYEKLQVSSRTQALMRGRSLNLLP